jgi:hypothetical protein
MKPYEYAGTAGFPKWSFSDFPTMPAFAPLLEEQADIKHALPGFLVYEYTT